MPVFDKDVASELALSVRAVLRKLRNPELLGRLARREKRAELDVRLLPARLSGAAGWRCRRALHESTIAPDPKLDAVDPATVTSEGQGEREGVVCNAEQNEDQLGTSKKSRLTPEHKLEIRRLKKELSRKKKEHALLSLELHTARRQGSGSEIRERVKLVKSIKQDVFYLRNEIDAVRQEAGGEPGMGALPDFAIIGAPKCGTTFLYHLLAEHPLVRPAAFKELHYFDLLHEKGEQWYRHCFSSPRHKDGQKTITGEATPGYLAHPDAPERMAAIAPQVRLIALLRNPVDRVYSGYHFFRSRQGRVTNEFDEHARAALEDPLRSKMLSQGIYVDQLAAWSKVFAREQMLVLKSETFFEDPRHTLSAVLKFLNLPAWEPDASELGRKRNKGPYEGGMAGETRRRLEEYYEPHNQRLYDYLGENFGW